MLWGCCLGAGLLLLLQAAAAAAADAAATPAAANFVYNKDFMSGILHAFMPAKGGINMTRLIEAFNPDPCLDRCLPSLSQLLDTFTRPPGAAVDQKETEAMCRQLGSVDSCAAAAKCDSTLLDLAAKTYQFACVNQIESIGDSLKCAQQSLVSSRAECETGCIVPRGAAAAAAASLDPDTLPLDATSICESSVCLLGCIQKQINSACGSTRNGSPTLFNAILTTGSSSSDNTLSSMLSGLLPMDCRGVLKAQQNLPEKIASLAAVGKNSAPFSVGKAKAAAAAATTTAPTTTVTTAKPTVAAPAAAKTTVPPATTTTTTVSSHPMLWSPPPVEAPLYIDGEARTLQCKVLDWARQPVESPSMEKLALLIAQQLVKHADLEMRADDDAVPDDTMAFRRWAASHDAESYKALGFGVPTRQQGVAIPALRANHQPSSYPSWANFLLAALFPFVIYLID